MKESDYYQIESNSKKLKIKVMDFDHIIQLCEKKQYLLMYSYTGIGIVFVPHLVYLILQNLAHIDTQGRPLETNCGFACPENNSIIIDSSVVSTQIPHVVMHELLHLVVGSLHLSDQELFIGQLDLPLIELILNNEKFFKMLGENNFMRTQLNDDDVRVYFKEVR